jgi:hypothetical protein
VLAGERARVQIKRALHIAPKVSLSIVDETHPAHPVRDARYQQARRVWLTAFEPRVDLFGHVAGRSPDTLPDVRPGCGSHGPQWRSRLSLPGGSLANFNLQTKFPVIKNPCSPK